MVQTLGVLPKNGHVNHTGLPDLAEAAVNLVRDALVEFDGTDVGVEVEPAAKAENHRSARKIPVGQPCSGIADGAEEDGVGFITAQIKRAFCPFLAGFHVVLSTARDDGLIEPMVGVGLDGVQYPLGFNRHFFSCSVAGQNCDAVVTHIRSHQPPLLERNPAEIPVD